MARDKVKIKRDVNLEAQKEKKKVNFVTWMDICHLNNAELEPTHQKYKGLVVLRGDRSMRSTHRTRIVSVTNDSSNKVMDVIARMPDCAGQAADAASAYTQVNIQHKWPTSWSNIEDPVVPIE